MTHPAGPPNTGGPPPGQYGPPQRYGPARQDEPPTVALPIQRHGSPPQFDQAASGPPALAGPGSPTGSSRHTGPPAQQSRVRRAVLGVGTLVATIVVITVVKLVVAGGVGEVVDRVTDDPNTAAVGDCLTGGAADDLAVVACTDPKATHRILAKVDGTRALFDLDDDLTFCRSAPETESAFFEGPDTGAGFILCLAPVSTT